MGEQEFIALVERFPWVLDVFQWLVVAKQWWHAIESAVLLLGLFWISRRLRSERVKMTALVINLGGQIENLDDKLDEKIDTVAQMAKAAREAAETIPATAIASGSPGSLAHWEQLRADWQEMRERIELAIEGIKHKLVRGKYAKIDRYSYRDIIVTLREDGIIKPQAEVALVSMNQRFMSLKTRPSQTTAADVEKFEGWMREVNGSLPKRARPETESVPPLPFLPKLEAAE